MSYKWLNIHKISKSIICFIIISAFIFNFVLMDVWAVVATGQHPVLDSGVQMDVGMFRLPEELGKIEDIYQGTSDKVVLHVQEVHCNYGAQKKIADIIDYLNREYGITTVNLEGGKGNYDLTPFTDIEDIEVREKAAEFFIKEGLINGAEYFAALNPDRVKLWGVEDSDLYFENLNVYRNSLSYQKEVQKLLKNLKRNLNILKKELYSQELLELDMKCIQHDKETIEFKDYVTYLTNKAQEKTVDLKTFPNVYMLHESLKAENNINFRQANIERDKLIDRLQKRLSKVEIEELVIKTIEFRRETLAPKAFYSYLLNKSKAVVPNLKDYPELEKYTTYLFKYETVDKAKSIEEIESLEITLKEILYENDKQRKLNLLSKNLALMDKFFSICLTRKDYDYYLSHKKEFNITNFTDFINAEAISNHLNINLASQINNLDKYRTKTAKFYEYGFKRDNAFLRNIQITPNVPNRVWNNKGNRSKPGLEHWGRFTSYGQRATVLITGGFHTENLKKQFKKQNISYVSITPEFENEEGYESPYFKILNGEKSAFMKAVEIRVKASGLAIYSRLSEMIKNLSEGVLFDRAVRVYDDLTTKGETRWWADENRPEVIEVIWVTEGNIARQTGLSLNAGEDFNDTGIEINGEKIYELIINKTPQQTEKQALEGCLWSQEKILAPAYVSFMTMSNMVWRELKAGREVTVRNAKEDVTLTLDKIEEEVLSNVTVDGNAVYVKRTKRKTWAWVSTPLGMIISFLENVRIKPGDTLFLEKIHMSFHEYFMESAVDDIMGKVNAQDIADICVLMKESRIIEKNEDEAVLDADEGVTVEVDEGPLFRTRIYFDGKDYDKATQMFLDELSFHYIGMSRPVTNDKAGWAYLSKAVKEGDEKAQQEQEIQQNMRDPEKTKRERLKDFTRIQEVLAKEVGPDNIEVIGWCLRNSWMAFSLGEGTSIPGPVTWVWSSFYNAPVVNYTGDNPNDFQQIAQKFLEALSYKYTDNRPLRTQEDYADLRKAIEEKHWIRLGARRFGKAVYSRLPIPKRLKGELRGRGRIGDIPFTAIILLCSFLLAVVFIKVFYKKIGDKDKINVPPAEQVQESLFSPSVNKLLKKTGIKQKLSKFKIPLERQALIDAAFCVVIEAETKPTREDFRQKVRKAVRKRLVAFFLDGANIIDGIADLTYEKVYPLRARLYKDEKGVWQVKEAAEEEAKTKHPEEEPNVPHPSGEEPDPEPKGREVIPGYSLGKIPRRLKLNQNERGLSIVRPVNWRGSGKWTAGQAQREREQQSAKQELKEIFPYAKVNVREDPLFVANNPNNNIISRILRAIKRSELNSERYRNENIGIGIRVLSGGRIRIGIQIPSVSGDRIRMVISATHYTDSECIKKINEKLKELGKQAKTIHTFRFDNVVWGYMQAGLAARKRKGDLTQADVDTVKKRGLSWVEYMSPNKVERKTIADKLGKDKAKIVWEEAMDALRERDVKVNSIYDVMAVVDYHEKIHEMLKTGEYNYLIEAFTLPLYEEIGVPDDDHSFIKAINKTYGSLDRAEQPSRSSGVMWSLEEFLTLSIQEAVLFNDPYAVLKRMGMEGEEYKTYTGVLDKFFKEKDVISFSDQLNADMLYQTAEKFIPHMSNIMRQDVRTYAIEPDASEDDLDLEEKYLGKLQNKMRDKAHPGYARSYKADDQWVGNLKGRVAAMIPSFYNDVRGISNESGDYNVNPTRMIIRLFSQTDDEGSMKKHKVQIEDYIETMLMKQMGSNISRKRIVAKTIIKNKIKFVTAYAKDAKYLNTAIDLFMDMTMVELDRYGHEYKDANKYGKKEAPEDLIARFLHLLRLSTTNYDEIKKSAMDGEKININEVLKTIFSGHILKIRAIDWTNLSEWKKQQDAVLRSL